MERKEIDGGLLDHGLGQLRDWLDRIEAAGSAWRATGHSLALSYEDGTLAAWEE